MGALRLDANWPWPWARPEPELALDGFDLPAGIVVAGIRAIDLMTILLYLN